MRITASYETFKNAWKPPTSHDFPILYTVTPLGKINTIYPMIDGQFYEWVVDGVAPTEGDFLATYGYAHKVSSVLP